MIRHSLPILQWLRGWGAVKANVTPDRMTFNEGIQVASDVGIAPGTLLGPELSFACGGLVPAGGAGNFQLVLMNGGAYGSVIDWFMGCGNNNGVGDIIWRNDWVNPGGLNSFVNSDNMGGQMFDDQATGATVSSVGRFVMQWLNNAAVYATTGTGTTRTATMPVQNNQTYPLGFYVPPGLSGFGFVTQDANQPLEFVLGGRMLPFSGLAEVR